VGVRRGGGRGCGGVGGGDVVAVLQAGDGAIQGGVGIAVHLRLVGGGDDQRSWGDGEGAVDERHGVVAQRGRAAVHRRRHDRVAPNGARGRGRGAVGGGDGVLALDAAGR